MAVTPEIFAAAEEKKLRNVLDKIARGKTTTAREDAMLASARLLSSAPEGEVQTPGAGTILSGFAKTWDELAEVLSVDRRTLTNVRNRYGKECPRDAADGRKDIAAWANFLAEKGVRGRGMNNSECDFLDERKLRLEERKLRVDRERFELQRAKAELAPVAHFESALGVLLAAFHQALEGLPDRIADGIDQADRDCLMALLKRAEKDKLSYKVLRGMIEKGKVRPFSDFHERAAFVQSEVDGLRKVLLQGDYLEANAEADEE